MSTEWTPRLHYTGHLIRRAQQLHVALWNQHVSIEVSSVQFAALLVARERPGLSQADLCDELGLDRSTIADLVERMVRRGLLASSKSTEDRRRKVLSLTAAGAATLSDLSPAVDRINEMLTSPLADDEIEQLHSVLRRMVSHGISEGTIRP